MKDLETIHLEHNESYWLHDGSDIEELRDLITTDKLTTYPSYDELRLALSNYVQAPLENIIITAGSDSLIALLMSYCSRFGLPIAMPVPTFYGYERIATQQGATLIPTYYHEYEGQFVFPISEVIETITSGRAKSVFLCSPNNPLGCPIPDDALAAILDTARDHGVLAVIDEAYIEFGGTSSIHRLGSQPLVIIRTLSKAFGLSGARIGYGIASGAVLADINALLLPWPVASTSVTFALALLRNADAMKERRDALIDVRKTFASELSRLPGITVFPSCTNFVLIRVARAEEVAMHLKRKEIYVAETSWMTSFDQARATLTGTLRLATPAPADMHRVLEAIRESLQT